MLPTDRPVVMKVGQLSEMFLTADRPAVNGRATITTPAEAGYGLKSLLQQAQFL